MAIIFQDYERLKFLGKGSFAKIYKVRHKDLGYIRAIKVLTEEVNEEEDDKVYKTFLKECSLLLRIGNGCHPNIIRIYQPRKIDGQALVEMDYVDGVTLEEYISTKRFVPTEEILRFIREIGSALAYCHVDCYRYMMRQEEKDKSEEQLIREYGVAHNDIHSNNIMRKDLDGSYVLLDFGLAIQDDKAVKSSSRGDGAAEYIPPEKWSGAQIANEKAIDIYGFGILLYQMLTGRVPFVLDPEAYRKDSLRTLNEIRRRHEQERPADILPLRAEAYKETHPGKDYERDYPEWLDELVFKCLEKNPDDRFHDGKELMGFVRQKELADELARDAALDQLKTENASLKERIRKLEENRPEPEPKPEPVPVAKRSLWLTVAVIVLLLTTGLGAYGTWTNAFDTVSMNRIKGLQNANDQLTKELVEAKKQQKSAQTNTDLETTVNDLKKKKNSLTEEVKKKDEEISKKDSQIATLQSQVEEKDKQIATLQASDQSATVNQLKKDKQKLQNENAELKKKVENLTDLLLKK